MELKRDSVGKKSNHSSPPPIRVRAITRLKASCSSRRDFNQSKYVPLKLKANWKGPEVMELGFAYPFTRKYSGSLTRACAWGALWVI